MGIFANRIGSIFMVNEAATPSLQKIADASGVSVSTVSRVLAKQNNVSPRTRDRVIEVARRMRYRPNMLVRGMQTGQTHTVGVMLRVGDPFYAAVYEGVHDQLLQADHVPILVWPGFDTRQASKAGVSELDQIHRLVDRRVDGVILVPVEDAASDTYWHEIWDRRIPLVAVDRELSQSKADFVGCNDRQIGQLAAEYLLSLGHRRLGHLAGPDFTSTGRQRRESFEQVVQQAADAQLHVFAEPTFRDGLDKAKAMLDRPDRPTAIFAANDHLAMGVYDAAASLGLAIPEDLSVLGCGKMAWSGSLRPPLSTIDQRAYEIGQHAAQLLLKRKFENHESSDHTALARRIRLRPQLIERQSVARISH